MCRVVLLLVFDGTWPGRGCDILAALSLMGTDNDKKLLVREDDTLRRDVESNLVSLGVADKFPKTHSISISEQTR